MLSILVAFCIFTAVFCLATSALLLVTDPQVRHQRQLKKRLKSLQHSEGPTSPESVLKTSGSRLSSLLLERLPKLETMELSLIQAGLSWRLEVFLSLIVLSGTVFLSLGLLKWGLAGALAGGAVGTWLPLKFLAFKRRQRFGKFERQLPDALDLLARGLKAGHALTSGLQLVAHEIGSPLGPEFFKTFQEHSHGLDLNTALLNLCRRIDLQDLRFFTTAVVIQRETGGNLADILDKIATLTRERFKLRNQVNALTAEGRLSGIVLILLTPLTALALFFMNPSYIQILWQTPKGQTISMTALTLQVLGIFIIRHIVKIKV